jgi:hypothetical protein
MQPPARTSTDHDGQHGAALLLMVMALFAGGTALFLGGYAGAGNRDALRREAATTTALARAKELVLGFAVSGAAGRPGGLTFPDRNNDGNYDGKEDCPTVPLHAGLLLGKMPHIAETGCIPARPGFGEKSQDAHGEVLWYAVSRHLMHPYYQPALNSATTGNWLTVRGADGSVISAEAAVVLIAPGTALAGQNRYGNPGPARFLDSITIDGITYNNADDDEDFIQALPSATFNDRLAWITRSEFMTAVTWRVAGEVQLALDDHHATSGSYPPDQNAFGTAMAGAPAWFAANLWDIVTSYTRVNDNRVTIGFTGCAIIFTLERDQPTRRNPSQC